MYNQSNSVLIIKSKDKNETNSDVLKTVKANVNLAADKIAINGTKLIQNGMLINCSNEESLDKLKSAVEAKFSNKYKITSPSLLNLNNTFLEDCDIKVIGVIKLKYSLNFIIEVDPDVRKQIISCGYLFTSWKKCVVSDHFSVVRCFKCSRFGHAKKDCKNKTVCSLCSNEHEDKACDSNIKKCGNCFSYNNYMMNQTRTYKPFPVDHAASDRLCPCFLERIAVLKSRIDYG
nr:unnamed protein product [Callosobruchus chinensis]